MKFCKKNWRRTDSKVSLSNEKDLSMGTDLWFNFTGCCCCRLATKSCPIL